ncbi:MAG TPA: hypothetical protein VEA38_17855 [Terriglobales bacterium]|nr:hypothetical protein [Terriglobales bacterium]
MFWFTFVLLFVVLLPPAVLPEPVTDPLPVVLDVPAPDWFVFVFTLVLRFVFVLDEPDVDGLDVEGLALP